MSRHLIYAEQVVEGVVDAWDAYTAMCGSCDVHNTGIEAFISVKIAENLKRNAGDEAQVWLEPGVRKLLTMADAVPRRGAISKDLRHNGRIDIALCDKKGFAKGVVEVKRHFMPSNFIADIRRIDRLLDRAGGASGTIRWGIVAAMHLVWDEKRHDPEARLLKFFADAQEAAPTRRIERKWSKERAAAAQSKPNEPAPISAKGIALLIS